MLGSWANQVILGEQLLAHRPVVTRCVGATVMGPANVGTVSP
jgi:hypothetical protein